MFTGSVNFLDLLKGGVKMGKNLDIKKDVVSEIKEKLDKSVSIVMVDYRGLDSEQVAELRNHLREAGVEYKIYKNTLLKLAMEDEKYNEIKNVLEGPTAVAFSYTDATIAARKLNDITKKYQNLQFKAGIVENIYYDENKIKEIGEIPSREELLSKLLGSLKSPITNFARVLKQVAEKSA